MSDRYRISDAVRRLHLLFSVVVFAACGTSVTHRGERETAEGNDPRCPATRPDQNGDCAAGLTCGYPADDTCANPTQAFCDVPLGWIIMVAGDATCPAEQPLGGTACPLRCGQAVAGEYDCGYAAPAPCAAGSEIRVTCVGTWEVNAPPCAVCPVDAPTAGSACEPEGELCGYDDGGCSRWRCDGGSWQRHSWDPNACSNTITYCPTELPSDGDACTDAEGFTCHYAPPECDPGQTLAASCNSLAQWVIAAQCG